MTQPLNEVKPVTVDDVITTVQSKITSLQFDLDAVFSPDEDAYANCLQELNEYKIILSALRAQQAGEGQQAEIISLVRNERLVFSDEEWRIRCELAEGIEEIFARPNQ